MTFNCAGLIIDTEPAYAHISLQSLVRQGLPSTRTFGFVGIHVPAGIGIHGWGVSTPSAAAVAAATAGLANDVHIPKGPMFAPP